MAHFAQVTNGVVQQVIVVANSDAPDEVTGQAFIASLGLDGEWVQTSYNAKIRGAYAGVGYTWDGTNFVSPVVEPELPIEE